MTSLFSASRVQEMCFCSLHNCEDVGDPISPVVLSLQMFHMKLKMWTMIFWWKNTRRDQKKKSFFRTSQKYFCSLSLSLSLSLSQGQLNSHKLNNVTARGSDQESYQSRKQSSTLEKILGNQNIFLMFTLLPQQAAKKNFEKRLGNLRRWSWTWKIQWSVSKIKKKVVLKTRICGKTTQWHGRENKQTGG